MKNHRKNLKSNLCYLGIEGGGTRTRAVWMDSHGQVTLEKEKGPCNLRLNSDSEILSRFREVHALAPCPPAVVGIFLAGCRTRTDKLRLLRLAGQVWPQARFTVGNDTVSAFAAALGEDDGLVVICGTGSIVRARRKGVSIKVGGWGHIGGDEGSGYWMGRRLLISIFRAYDETGQTHALAQSVLDFIGLNTIDEVIRWSMDASKFEIASLTRPLFRHHQNPVVRKILQEACRLLAEQVRAAAKKAGFPSSKKSSVPVVINPGLARHQPVFFKLLKQAISREFPAGRVSLSRVEGAMGAARLALRMANTTPLPPRENRIHRPRQDPQPTPHRDWADALTEQRNPRSMKLDRLSILPSIHLMLDEEARVIPALRKHSRELAKAVDWTVSAFQKKGRLFYLGAGTSGRLGILDAAECPPTFSTDPEMVQGIMAGGKQAVFRAVEAVEDDAGYGRQAVRDRGVTARDVVVGIAASGSTPFVLGALEEAHQRGAHVILLTFNPSAAFTLPGKKFLKIAVATGPEIITGSTRLKAGTATKLALNLLSTLSMVRQGKVQSNLMIDLQPNNLKLRDRAARIYAILQGTSLEMAVARLERCGWNLKKALKR